MLLIVLSACTQVDDNSQPLAPVDVTKDAATESVPYRYDPQVRKLFENPAKVSSYSFDLVLLPDRSTQRTYLVNGQRAKVVLQEELLVPGGVVDVVYLDLENKTATGYCTRERKLCTDLASGTPLPYPDYEIVLPQDWVSQLEKASFVNSRTHEGVQATVVQYTAGDAYYEAYVHPFFGLPMRVAIATDSAMTNIYGGYEYRSIAFNAVQDRDVMPPSAP
jgi:hypothetical protein